MSDKDPAGGKRILLTCANARYTHSSLALPYLRNAILSAGRGHDVGMLEFQINQPRLQILQDIVLARPEVMGISVSIWSALLVRSLMADIRALLPDCLIILGGPEVSWSAADWLAEYPAIDVLVAGAGEGAIAWLAALDFDLDRARRERPVAFGLEGRVLRVPAPHFSRQAFPYRDEDFAALAGRYLYYESSRGCPFACAYCLSSREDQGMEMKDTAVVLDELARINRHRPMLVKFVDRTFNADPARARDIWRFLAEEDRQRRSGGRLPARELTRYHFEVHPALLEEDDFSLLGAVRPGLFQFEVGVQSVNAKALAAIRRPVDWVTARAAVQRLIALGTVHVHLDLIAGLPGEGMAEIGRSFDAILDLGPDHFQVGFLKAFPGTNLRDQAAADGLVHQSQAPYEILENRWLSVVDLAELRRVEDLLEATWNAGIGRDRLKQGRDRFGGWFAAFRALAAFALRTGHEFRIRQPARVEALLDDWLTAAETGRTVVHGRMEGQQALTKEDHGT